VSLTYTRSHSLAPLRDVMAAYDDHSSLRDWDPSCHACDQYWKILLFCRYMPSAGITNIQPWKSIIADGSCRKLMRTAAIALGILGLIL